MGSLSCCSDGSSWLCRLTGSLPCCSDGSSWLCRLRLYSFEDNNSNQVILFVHEELNNGFLDALGHDEYIENMFVYKCFINKPELIEHHFVVFKTKTWWYSIEKTEKDILFQRSTDIQKVSSNIMASKRKQCNCIGYPALVKNHVSVHGLIYMLHKGNELNKGYCLATKNCRHFVDNVLKFAETKNNVQTIENVDTWFIDVENNLEKTIYGKKLLKEPRRIFILGEMVFPVSNKTGYVCKPTGKRIEVQDKTKITVLAGFNATGEYLHPLISFPENGFTDEYMSGFPEASYSKTSDGWVCSAELEGFVKTLKNFVTDRKIPRPIILFVDGLERRLTQNGAMFCKLNRIILFELLTSASHILQSAQIGWFPQNNPAWEKAVEQLQKTNKRPMHLKDFSVVLAETWKQVATSQNAADFFETSSLFPFTVSVSSTSQPETNATVPVSNTTQPETNATVPVSSTTQPETNATVLVSSTTQPETNALVPVSSISQPETNAEATYGLASSSV